MSILKIFSGSKVEKNNSFLLYHCSNTIYTLPPLISQLADSIVFGQPMCSANNTAFSMATMVSVVQSENSVPWCGNMNDPYSSNTALVFILSL